jgi:hypothetical protein
LSAACQHPARQVLDDTGGNVDAAIGIAVTFV